VRRNGGLISFRVISRRTVITEPCPLYPRKRSSGTWLEMSASCHKQTNALQQTTRADCNDLLDHLVGTTERPRLRLTERYGMFRQYCPNHSSLMLANFTTLAHFSDSVAI